MSWRVALLSLALSAAPVAAQETGQAPLSGWSPEGWNAAPLDDLPEMDLEIGPLDMDPLQPESGPLEMYDQPIENGILLEMDDPPATPRIVAAVAPDGAVLRGLDKMAGETLDLNLQPGQTGRVGRLAVTLGECRYPEDNPASDAYAYLTIFEDGRDGPLFSGWMLASSPALNPLDHPRYDVWVLRCNNVSGEGNGPAQ